MKRNNPDRNRRNDARSTHVGKTSGERNYYTKAIKDLRSEPTLDESLDFIDSDDLDSDFSTPESTKKRKVPLNLRAREYLENNWYIWLPTFIVLVVTPWFFANLNDHKERIIRVEAKADYLGTDISEIKSDFKETRKEIGDHSFTLNELRVRLELKDKQSKSK